MENMLIKGRICFHQFGSERLNVENLLIESTVCLETFIIKALCFFWQNMKNFEWNFSIIKLL